jgi:hypothetical protein
MICLTAIPTVLKISALPFSFGAGLSAARGFYCPLDFVDGNADNFIR